MGKKSQFNLNECILSLQGKIFSFLLPIFEYLHEVVTSMHLSFVLRIKNEGEFFFYIFTKIIMVIMSNKYALLRVKIKY